MPEELGGLTDKRGPGWRPDDGGRPAITQPNAETIRPSENPAPDEFDGSAEVDKGRLRRDNNLPVGIERFRRP